MINVWNGWQMYSDGKDDADGHDGGTIVTAVCDSGYEHEDNSMARATCVRGAWSNDLTVCIGKYCSRSDTVYLNFRVVLKINK